MSHSKWNVHDKVKAMVVDQRRNYLYSAGEERFINVLDFGANKLLGLIKVGNASPTHLEIDADLSRLYVSTKEGLLISFDISRPAPVMDDYIKLVPAPSPLNVNVLKQIDIDLQKNILLYRMKNNSLHMLMASQRKGQRMQKLETLNTYSEGSEGKDFISKFKWLDRMSCYCEGTTKGLLKIRDMMNLGEVLMYVQDAEFTEKVEHLYYNKDRNILFASSRDGKFRVWKVPQEWRSKWVDS